jgi:hypothetical protein
MRADAAPCGLCALPFRYQPRYVWQASLATCETAERDLGIDRVEIRRRNFIPLEGL